MIMPAVAVWKLNLVHWGYILETIEVLHVIFRFQVYFQNQNKYFQRNRKQKKEKELVTEMLM